MGSRLFWAFNVESYCTGLSSRQKKWITRKSPPKSTRAAHLSQPNSSSFPSAGGRGSWLASAAAMEAVRRRALAVSLALVSFLEEARAGVSSPAVENEHRFHQP